MSTANQSALYNKEFSSPFVNNLRVDEKSPGLNPRITSEIIKFTPIGLSPTDAKGSQVASFSQERYQNSSSSTGRSY